MREPESRLAGIETVLFADVVVYLGSYGDSGCYLATLRRLMIREEWVPILYCGRAPIQSIALQQPQLQANGYLNVMHGRCTLLTGCMQCGRSAARFASRGRHVGEPPFFDFHSISLSFLFTLRGHIQTYHVLLMKIMVPNPIISFVWWRDVLS